MSERRCDVCTMPTDGFICSDCLRQLERAIGDMPSQLRELEVTFSRQARVYRSNNRSLPPARAGYPDEQPAQAWLRSPHRRDALTSTRMPVNLDAGAQITYTLNALTSWTQHLAETRGVETPTNEEMVGWLLANIEAVRFDEAAAEMHNKIIDLHSVNERLVDRSEARAYAGPCLHDGCERDLYRNPESDSQEIVCDGHRGDGRGCGHHHSIGDRQEWLAAAMTGSLVTIDDVLAALPVLFPELPRPKRGTVLAWVRQGRLIAHGRDPVGEDLFVGSELLGLIAAHKPHRFAPRRKRAA